MHSANYDNEDDWEPKRREPTCSWPVDVAHLGRYTLGNKALEREVLGLFAGEAARRIAAFRQAATSKDWRMAAHTLKGSGRAIGAWRIASLAALAEQIDGSADRDAAESAIRGLEDAMSETLSYIEELSHLGDMQLKRTA